MNTAGPFKPQAVMVAPSKFKYKGRWGVMKRAKSVFIEFTSSCGSLYLDLFMALEPDYVSAFLKSLAEEQSLKIKPELPEGTYVELRNDSIARECIREFDRLILPQLAMAEYNEHFSHRVYFCGDLAIAKTDQNKYIYPWDDSKEIYKQTLALDDGRVIKAIAWSEYGESFVDYEMSTEDLPQMNFDELLKYLSDQGFKTFEKVNKNKLSIRRKSNIQHSISKTSPVDQPDYVITWHVKTL